MDPRRPPARGEIPAPPPALRGRVMDSLRARELLRPPRPPARRLWLATAAGALFGSGWWLGARAPFRGNPGPAAGSPPRFVLLLYSNGPERGPDEEARVAEYRAWARELRREGRLELGERLGLEHTIVGGAAPAGERVAGLFIVSAPTLADAAAIAATCPHVRYGGRVEVRGVR